MIALQEQLLRDDLAILGQMVTHADAYLVSDATRWDMAVATMPPMTIGGVLMRLRRLEMLREQLSAEEQHRLDAARSTFDAALVEKVVRFEQRAHDELHARLREWTTYLRDLPGKSAADNYVGKVDGRVVIAELAAKLDEPPYHQAPRLAADMAAVDNRLRALWAPGGFVWDAVWEAAYPPDRFWYLYGVPRHS